MTDSVTPTFLYIGIGKAASTWIYEALREHPDVFVPKLKDIRFFEDGFYLPERYQSYLKNFRDGKGFQAVGELSHNYILSASCAERIATHLPDIKLIVCLREPGDWVKAAYSYSRLFRSEASEGFDSYRDTLLKERGVLNFVDNLSAYYARFDARQIHVMFYEDILADEAEVLKELYTFLNVDSLFLPSILHQRVNSARSARFGNRTTQLMNQLAQTLRSLGLANLVGLLKHNKYLNQLIFSEVKVSPNVPTAEIQKIRTDTSKQYRDIEKLIGRSLPPDWWARLDNEQ